MICLLEAHTRFCIAPLQASGYNLARYHQCAQQRVYPVSSVFLRPDIGDRNASIQLHEIIRSLLHERSFSRLSLFALWKRIRPW